MSGLDRLNTHLAGSRIDRITSAQNGWGSGQKLLEEVAALLEGKAPAIAEHLGTKSKTGKAAEEAFVTAAAKLRHRAKLMGQGASALGQAGDALRLAANSTLPPLRDEPGSKPRPTTSVPTKADTEAETKWQNQKTAYESSVTHRDTAAGSLADHVDAIFAASTETMKSIHGELGGDTSDSTSSGQPDTPDTTVTTPYSGRALVGVDVSKHRPGSSIEDTVSETGHTPSHGATLESGFPAAPGTPSDPGYAGGSDNPAYPGSPGSAAVPAASATAPAGLPIGSIVGGGAIAGAGLFGMRALGSVLNSRGLGLAAAAGVEAPAGQSGTRGAAGRAAGTQAAGSGGRGVLSANGAAGARGQGKKARAERPEDLWDDGSDWIDDEGVSDGVVR